MGKTIKTYCSTCVAVIVISFFRLKMPCSKIKSNEIVCFSLFYYPKRYELKKIPIVTLFIIALNVFVFINSQSSIYLRRVCIDINQTWNINEYWRSITSQIHHIHDFHLYYNIVSFSLKGVNIEKKLQSYYFAYLLAVFAVLTSSVTLALDALFFQAFGTNYNQQCVIGFSGIIFALKVLATESKTFKTNNVTFLRTNVIHSCWLELILIQILFPQVSLAGNLAGIIVGLAYTKGLLSILCNEFQPLSKLETTKIFQSSDTNYDWYYNGIEYVEGKSEVLAYELASDDAMGRNQDFYN